jgi:hypothetical protein
VNFITASHGLHGMWRAKGSGSARTGAVTSVALKPTHANKKRTQDALTTAGHSSV